MIDTSTTNTLIVILNWNGIEDTLLCIDSVLKQSTPADILVIDNGSVDESVKILHNKYNKLVVLAQPKNLGFAGGVNVGIEYAIHKGYTYLALLNNDAVVKRDWLEKLETSIRLSESIGIATGLLLNEDGTLIDSAGEEYSKWGVTFSRNRGDMVTNSPKSGFIFGATGGATLYKTSLFKDIGIFDEDFFAYYEDADINFRAQLAGYKVIYNSQAIAYHKHGATSKKIPGFTIYQTFKNLPLVFLKNIPKGMIISTGLRFYTTYIFFIGNAIFHRQFKPVFKGVFMSFILGFKKLSERRHIQTSKKVSTSYIRSIIWPDLPPKQVGMRKIRHIFTGKV